jgi:DNA-binding NtrC family response regulator
VGGTREVELDVRVIATTNRDLDEDAQKGRFRRDLHFRLKVIHIALPPLRERPGDIPLLVEHCLARFTSRLRKRARAVAPHVMEALIAHPWPGNIRELENVLEVEVNLTSEEQTVLEQVPDAIQPRPLPADARTLDELERDSLLRALADHGGSIPEVARQLGVSRGTVYNKLRRFAIDLSAYRSRGNGFKL